ncbi:hypothetical protein MOSE0_A03598 [Monosporozyma servazzii]
MNIWVASSDGRTDLVEQFLNNGSGITANSKDPNGYTPVHAAAAYGHVDLLKKLCTQYGGDINVRDSDGDTPLHHCEDMATAQVIIEELNGDINAVNGEGKTALQVFEEDAEFPELIDYMRVKCGVPIQLDSFGIKKEDLAQFKESLRFTLENDPVDESNPESMARRKRLEEIIQSENSEQELENYIREMIRSSDILDQDGNEMAQVGDEPATKRRR